MSESDAERQRRIEQNVKTSHVKVGHSNVCKPMTKWDTLMWDPPITIEIEF